ncbi:MAG: hypothetical protein VXW22_17395, partial [Pseudomonadota bacterium]|nr:hypothetical protein [Pseudomonadota bacterium]
MAAARARHDVFFSACRGAVRVDVPDLCGTMLVAEPMPRGHGKRVRVGAQYSHMAPLSFVLDCVIGADADQASAYAEIGASATEGVLNGHSATIIAFGAAGSGKSHTLFGPP